MKLTLAAMLLAFIVSGCTHTSVVVVTTTTVVKKNAQDKIEDTDPYWPSILPPVNEFVDPDPFDQKEKKEEKDGY